MADWIHFLFHTAAVVSGLASLLAVRPRGSRKVALRSMQTLASEAAACRGSGAPDLRRDFW